MSKLRRAIQGLRRQLEDLLRELKVLEDDAEAIEALRAKLDEMTAGITEDSAAEIAAALDENQEAREERGMLARLVAFVRSGSGDGPRH